MKLMLRRLDALEKVLFSEPIVLHMPDGGIETLPSHQDYVFDLFKRACSGDRTGEMELIAQNIASTEPGGAHMMDVVRAVLNSPWKNMYLRPRTSR